jgi:hypothetical protein
MNKTLKTRRRIAVILVAVMVVALLPKITVANAAKKPLVGVSYDGENSTTLYVGMQWSPRVCYEYGVEDDEDGNNVWMYESAGTLKGVSFSSSKPSVASVSKKGIVKAKKSGTTKITITSEELTKTIKVKVLAIEKVNKKNLVKEVKHKSSDYYDWPVYNTYDKSDTDVKKGYVKAGVKYHCTLYSVRKYKQPSGKYRYVFAYQVLDKKGKAIKGAEKVEVPAERVLVLFGLCNRAKMSISCIAGYVNTENSVSWGWQSQPYPSTKKGLKEARTYARENIYTSEDDYYKATYKYGWRNLCGE